MSTQLSAGGAEVTVDQENGCRISSLRIDGTELLRQGSHYGCFPMVPWCGRTANGQFQDGAVVHQLPINQPPHAIHGFGRDAPWRPARVTPAEAAFTYDLTEPWPYPGRVTQIVELGPDSLTLTLGVETYGDSFPAQAGWHPWFHRNLGAGGGTYASTSHPTGRRSAAPTTCPPASASTRCPAPGTTASACRTASWPP